MSVNNHLHVYVKGYYLYITCGLSNVNKFGCGLTALILSYNTQTTACTELTGRGWFDFEHFAQINHLARAPWQKKPEKLKHHQPHQRPPTSHTVAFTTFALPPLLPVSEQPRLRWGRKLLRSLVGQEMLTSRAQLWNWRHKAFSDFQVSSMLLPFPMQK